MSLVRLVKVYAAEKVQDAAYESKMNKVLTLQEHQGVAYGISRFMATVASTLVTLAVLSGGRAAVLTEGMTATALTSFLFYGRHPHIPNRSPHTSLKPCFFWFIISFYFIFGNSSLL